MFDWFEKCAPIRVKFRTLLYLHGLWALLSAAGAGLAAWGLPALGIGLAALSLAASLATVVISGRLICDPYVETVVRMEGLATGDLSSVIRFTDHSDCVGRMTKAMAVFRDNAAQVLRNAGEQQSVVDGLERSLSALENGDMTTKIDTPFADAYESLRSSFNRTVTGLEASMVQVVSAAECVRSGSAEIRVASDDLAQRTELQSTTLEQTSASMKHVTGMVADTARSAGDAGKGFAVVANEVRALAQRSSDAARDIRALITTSSTQVTLGVNLVGQTGHMLERIGTKIAEINALVDAIAKGAEIQSDTLNDIGRAVVSMDQMVQQNAAMVEETATAVRSLASEAECLADLTARFRLNGGATAPVRLVRQSASRNFEPSAVPAPLALARQTPMPVSGNLAISPPPSSDNWAEF